MTAQPRRSRPQLLGAISISLLVLLVGCSPSPEDRVKALVETAEQGDTAAVIRLLDAGADVNGTYKRPWPVGGRAGPALRVAAAAGDLPLARLLLDRGADPDFAEALQTAASYGRRDTVKLMLERGADTKVRNASGQTAFMAAIVSGHVDIAADLARFEQTGALVALLTGDVEMVAEAATRSMDVPGLPGVTLLHVAARAGQTAVVDRLLELGAPLEAACDAGGTWLGSPLAIAARAGRTPTVGLLLDRGADPNQAVRRGSVLEITAYAGQAEVIRLLVARGAKIDREQDLQPPLCAAAVEGQVAAIAALLDLGAKIDRPNASGLSPLRLAAGNAHLPAVKLLLERGASVDPNLATEIRNLQFFPAGADRREQITRLLERRDR